MSSPCFYCGVRTDVACRHRGATPLPQPTIQFECAPAKPVLDPRSMHTYFAGRIHRGMKPEQMFAMLAAQLQTRGSFIG